MIAFKGRLSFRQYLPAKPTKFGIKVWMRANPHNGYVHEFQSVRNSSIEDLPTMLHCDHFGRDQFPRFGGRTNLKTTGLLQPLNMSLTTDTGPGAVKSMPIHCVVEQMSSGVVGHDGEVTPKVTPNNKTSPGGTKNNPLVELDTYAILPGTTMFSELVRSALIKIGYTASEAVGAKGAIQIKNWKPLTFDTITDSPNSTLDEILGDLTSVATLRIRLCSHSKVTAMEEVKEKLLQFLLDRSQGMLTGCPIEKKLLSQISRGDYSETLPEGSRDAFNRWYKDQTLKNNMPPAMPAPRNPSPAPSTCSRVTTPSSPLPTTVTGFTSPRFDSTFPFRTRARTSFDVEYEIPRLQKWFTQNQHPSREQMVVYLNELNMLDSRKGKKPLDLTNIIYWFKNARAAVRRSSKCSPGGSDDTHTVEGNEESLDDHLSTSSTDNVPILPNRNAIYVVNPIHHDADDKIEVVHPHEDEDEEDMCDEDDEDEGGPHDFSHNLKCSVQDLGETNNNCVPMEQEEATDLRVHSKHSIMPHIRVKKEDNQMSQDHHKSSLLALQYKKEIIGDGDLLSGSSNSPSPSPQSSVGGHPASSQPLSIQSPHTALQMAAMSHALSMHYMHPASLYQNSPVVSGFSNKDPSNLSPHSTESSADRKKRSRVFIDPLSEIPKLEKWFEDDTHPSSYMIEKYTEELNRSAYRQRFPCLEPKNVQLWFKNHRAKVKRQRLGMDVTSPLSISADGSSEPASVS